MSIKRVGGHSEELVETNGESGQLSTSWRCGKQNERDQVPAELRSSGKQNRGGSKLSAENMLGRTTVRRSTCSAGSDHHSWTWAGLQGTTESDAACPTIQWLRRCASRRAHYLCPVPVTGCQHICALANQSRLIARSSGITREFV